MTTSRHKNSIIALATLGVYLGLLMAGGTPVLGHQGAMTRTFDVKDELELREKLDKKPDDERSPVTASVQIYLEDVEYFIASLERLRSKGTFDPRKDRFSVAQNTLLPCINSNLAGRYTPIRFETTSTASRKSLEYFSRGMQYGYSLGDCIVNAEFDGINAAESRFSFGLDDREFQVNVSVRKDSPQRAVELAREVKSTMQLYAANGATDLRQKLVAKTAVRAANDQVFVVTRLPRAGLVSLLSN
ncbi:MAG: hypothetical protein WBO10_10470 [Pyrinomonadaceae bacterium]